MLRAGCKNALLRRYEKYNTFLRLEVLSNNLRDFGLKKSLEHLDTVRETLAAVANRFSAFEAEALNVPVDFPLFQRLARPIVSAHSRIPGIQIHHTRMVRLMQVLLHAGPTLSGWRTAQIHQRVLATFGLDSETYTLTQLRYDLRKIKGHGPPAPGRAKLPLPPHPQGKPHLSSLCPVPPARVWAPGP